LNISTDIPKRVKQETVDEGKKSGHPDAVVIDHNIQAGKIKVRETKGSDYSEQIIASLNISGGESDSLRLFSNGRDNYDCIITDDQKFIDLIDGLGIPFLTPLSLLVYLANQKKISQDQALQYLDKMKPMISKEEYILTKEELSK
jgi:hypothetical protein